MRLSRSLLPTTAFAGAAVICLVAAAFAVAAVEAASETGVRRALDTRGQSWAEVEADGLRVMLTGTAPSEAARFAAIASAGTAVDAARVIDGMEVAETETLAPPRFSMEILRNDSGISAIGLIPAAADREDILRRLRRIAGEDQVADLLQTADYPMPKEWDVSVDYALSALEKLPRSKISVEAGRASVTAMTASAETRRALEAELIGAAPANLRLALDLSAPRPVITPFTLRFLIDGSGARFDACSAQDEKARDRILSAAAAAGLTGKAACTIGMGVPSPNWAEAAEKAIAALAELGGGTVTFADADITLEAAEGTPQATFDRVIGELEAALPEVFALHAVLPVAPAGPGEGPPEFTATLSPEGQVQLRGRVDSEALRELADSYAKAAFGSDVVYTAARIVGKLPADWTVRVLAGLEALSHLANGSVVVTPDRIAIQGVTEQEDTGAQIAQLMAEKLGESAAYEIDVSYRAPPPPVDLVPSPEECVRRIGMILEGGQITFEPGSATIDAASAQVMTQIADVLKTCGDIPLEVQGHTDSQGREEMNEQLSQERAQSVLNELRARRVLTGSYVARGYGESDPIADNATEEGREANRRIEFHLIRTGTDEDPTTPEASEAPAETEGEEEAEASQ